MEFFEFFSVAQVIVGYFTPVTEDFAYAVQLSLRILWLGLAIGLAIYAAFLVLGGLGLYQLAGRAGLKHRWMGFVPFLNTYYAGKVAGEANFFGQKMKRAGLYAAVIEGVYCLIELFACAQSFLTLYFPEEGSVIDPFTGESSRAIVPNLSEMPGAFRWMFVIPDWLCGLLEVLASFLTLVFLCVLFIAFFRKYFARSPIVMTLLCTILPFRGVTIFAVRKNAAVDYNAYMRRRMEEAMRRQQPYGPQGGPYNQGPYNGQGGQGGPYNQGPYNGQGGYGQGPAQNQGEPFSDFGGPQGEAPHGGAPSGAPTPPPPQDDDPFSDF